MISDFDFEATRKYHMVSDRERARWWKDQPVYLYMFEFYPFKFPIDYDRKPGIMTFFGKVNFKEEPKKYEQSISRQASPEERAGEDSGPQATPTPEERSV